MPCKGFPPEQLTNDHEPACMCHLYRLRMNTHVLTKHHALSYRATSMSVVSRAHNNRDRDQSTKLAPLQTESMWCCSRADIHNVLLSLMKVSFNEVLYCFENLGISIIVIEAKEKLIF